MPLEVIMVNKKGGQRITEPIQPNRGLSRQERWQKGAVLNNLYSSSSQDA